MNFFGRAVTTATSTCVEPSCLSNTSNKWMSMVKLWIVLKSFFETGPVGHHSFGGFITQWGFFQCHIRWLIFFSGHWMICFGVIYGRFEGISLENRVLFGLFFCNDPCFFYPPKSLLWLMSSDFGVEMRRIKESSILWSHLFLSSLLNSTFFWLDKILQP